jgi:hypothetical protein
VSEAFNEVTQALDAASHDLGKDLIEAARQREAYPDGPPHPVTSGVRLVYAVARLTDDQRDGLRYGIELSESDRKQLASIFAAVRSGQELATAESGEDG